MWFWKGFRRHNVFHYRKFRPENSNCFYRPVSLVFSRECFFNYSMLNCNTKQYHAFNLPHACSFLLFIFINGVLAFFTKFKGFTVAPTVRTRLIYCTHLQAPLSYFILTFPSSFAIQLCTETHLSTFPFPNSSLTNPPSTACNLIVGFIPALFVSYCGFYSSTVCNHTVGFLFHSLHLSVGFFVSLLQSRWGFLPPLFAF